MKIGLYTVLALLFVILTAVATYMINPDTFAFDVFGIHLPKLPIAVWVAIPVALLALISILHMAFYSTKNFFSVRKLRGDAKKLEDSVYWSLIAEPTTVSYSNEDMRKSAAILSESILKPNSIESPDIPSRIRDTAKIILKINSGEYVDLKTQKFAKHLSENNPIVEKNNFNHLDSDPSFALKVIDFKDKYSEELVQKALDKAVETQDFYTLKKYAKDIGKERFFKLVDRAVNSKEDIGFNLEMLKGFISEYDLDCKDYYKIAKVALSRFEPDDNLALFKEFANKDEDAIPSYIYLLFRYEMLDKVKDILDESSEDEYRAFKAFYTLKKGKYNYKIDDVVTGDNICK